MKTQWLLIGIGVIGLLIVLCIVFSPKPAIAPEGPANAPSTDVIIDSTDTDATEPVPTPTEKTKAFNTNVSLKESENITFSDGLQVTLNTMSDSRCPADVQCIWAGELSAQFSVTGGNFGATDANVQLGTANSTSVTTHGYTFTLVSATETTATIIVSKSSQ